MFTDNENCKPNYFSINLKVCESFFFSFFKYKTSIMKTKSNLSNAAEKCFQCTNR